MQRIIQSRQHSGKCGKTFYYRFAVDSPTQNHYRNAHIGLGVKGVCHADELSYLFKNIYVELPDKDSMEFTAIKRFVYFSHYSSNNANDRLFVFRFHCSHRTLQLEIQTTTSLMQI